MQDFSTKTRRLAPESSRGHVVRSTFVEPPPAHRSRRRENLIGGCLAIGGAFVAFCCVASIVTAILLPSIYRAQRPEIQAIWCNRAERVKLDFVCDWKPTPPFETVPTLAGTPIEDPFLILTPATATPNGAAPTESSLNITPMGISIQTAATATPTITPSPTIFVPPTAPPTATPLPSPTPIPLPAAYKLDTSRIFYQAQTWNNCGPATLSMGLSYYGYRSNQSVAASYLKPDVEDKNVSPYQMVNYVNQQASTQVPVNALYRVGGSLETIKALLANNFPVIIEKGYEVNDLGWMGHYLLLVGYDDTLQVFYTFDSYLGHGNLQGLQETYAQIQKYWKHFNYTFIVIYDPPRRQEVLNLLGTLADPTAAAQSALEVARLQASDNPNDAWAWFNLGNSYTLTGDYERAVQAFDQAFLLGMPWRTLWYLHLPYVAYYAVGRYNDILAHAQATQSTTVYVEETFYYRGAALAAEGDIQGAVEAFNAALLYNKNFQQARITRDALQNGTFTKDLVLTIGVSG